jgi:hypothetical protein
MSKAKAESMDLRDYFAARAMQGLLASENKVRLNSIEMSISQAP